MRHKRIPPACFGTSQVADLAGVTVRQLQWWDEQGLLAVPHQQHARCYSAELAALPVGGLGRRLEQGGVMSQCARCGRPFDGLACPCFATQAQAEVSRQAIDRLSRGGWIWRQAGRPFHLLPIEGRTTSFCGGQGFQRAVDGDRITRESFDQLTLNRVCPACYAVVQRMLHPEAPEVRSA